MKNSRVNEQEKERIRAEIENQVEAFLNRGGKIDVLKNEHPQRYSKSGSVWHQQDDINPLAP